MMKQQTSWNEPVCTGGVMSNKHPVLFSSDAKTVFVISGSYINVFNAATSQLITVLKGHEKEVTAISLNPLNPLQLYSASRDKTVRLWDFQDGVVLKTWKIGDAVLAMNLDPKKPSVAYLLLLPDKKTSKQIAETQNDTEDMDIDENKTKGEKKDKKQTKKKKKNKDEESKNGVFRVMQYHFQSKQGSVLFRMNQYPRQMSISPKGDFIAVNPGLRYFYLYDINNKHFQRVPHRAVITTLIFHPVESLIAYGDKAGKIFHHYYLGGSSQLKSEMHWHAQAVHALAFSPDGNYMYSGGEEAVLVIWQKSTSAQQFLPRQGAIISTLSVSSDGLHFAATLADNTVRIFSTLSLEVERNIVGLKVQASSWKWGELKLIKPAMDLVVEPKNNLLVLNGAPGGIQFYDALADRSVSHFNISPSPQVTVFNGAKIPETIVTKACFSNNATHLITFDTRRDPAYTNKMMMKFWQYDYGKQRYVINTEVENPHKKKVTGVAFHPKGQLAVTCSNDSQFKLWRSVPREGGSNRVSWSCHGAGYYRDSPASAAAFSSDGTILAVAFVNEITLWDPVTLTLLKVLSHALSNDPKDYLRGIQFIPGTHFLVAHTPYAFYVWNLLTCSIWWSYSVPVQTIALEQASKKSTDSSRFAVGTKDYIFLFDANSPAPLCYWRVNKKSTIRSLAFLPATQRSGASIIYLTEKMELIKIEEKSKEELSESVVKSMEALALESRARSVSLEDVQPVTVDLKKEEQDKKKEKPKGKERKKGKATETTTTFERIYGKQKEEKEKAKEGDAMDVDEDEQLGQEGAEIVNPTKQFHTNIFDGPSHVIAAPSNIYMSFMESLMKKASQDIHPQLMEQDETKSKSEEMATQDAVTEALEDASVEDVDETHLLEAEFERNLISLNKRNYESILCFFTENLALEPKQPAATPKKEKKGKETKKQQEQEKEKEKETKKENGANGDNEGGKKKKGSLRGKKESNEQQKPTTPKKVEKGTPSPKPAKRKGIEENSEDMETQKKQKQKRSKKEEGDSSKKETLTPKKETTTPKKKKGNNTPTPKKNTTPTSGEKTKTPESGGGKQKTKRKKIKAAGNGV